jgi:Cu2+-exporting ATPase
MSCDGSYQSGENECHASVQAVVTLNHNTISMGKPIQTMHFQELLSAAGNYSIKVFNRCSITNRRVTIAPPKNAAGKYYCPMFCEDDKVYDEAGDCPVCGMDLVQAPDLTPAKTMYTCPMHPEIIQEGPGSCPTCGMDLVPMEPTESEDNKAF